MGSSGSLRPGQSFSRVEVIFSTCKTRRRFSDVDPTLLISFLPSRNVEINSDDVDTFYFVSLEEASLYCCSHELKKKKMMSHDWSNAAIMLRWKRCEKRLHGPAKDGSFCAGGLPKFNQISFGQISFEFVGPIVSL